MTTNDPTGAAAEHLKAIHAWAVALETSLYQGEWTHDDVREALSGIVNDAEALAALAAPATGGGEREQRFRELATEGAFKAIYRRCDQLAEVEDGLVFHAAKEIREMTDLLATRFTSPATGGGDNEHLAKIRERLTWVLNTLPHPESIDPELESEIKLVVMSAQEIAAENAALRARLAEAEDSRNRWRRAATRTGRNSWRRNWSVVGRTDTPVRTVE